MRDFEDWHDFNDDLLRHAVGQWRRMAARRLALALVVVTMLAVLAGAVR